jgi:hypothetical protein
MKKKSQKFSHYAAVFIISYGLFDPGGAFIVTTIQNTVNFPQSILFSCQLPWWGLSPWGPH